MASKSRLKLVLLAVVAASAVAVTTAAVPSEAASGPAPVTAGSRYLALGDSIAFGYRESNAQQAPDYGKASTFRGYPYLVAQDLNLRMTNAACPGETAASFITTAKYDHGCTVDEHDNPGSGYRANFPLHTTYTSSAESQLQFARAFLKKFPGTKLVTLQIGANDGLRCIDLGNCDTPQEQGALAGRVQKRLKTILDSIITKGGYKGQLVLVNYYSVNSASEQANNQSGLLNAVEAALANNYPTVSVADAYTRFAQGSMNAAGNDTCAAGLETILTSSTPPNGLCGIHPSLAGHALIASAVERVVKLS